MEENQDQEPKAWIDVLGTRMQKHVAYARHYAQWYAHGAPGHLDLMTIATLAEFLDNLSAEPESAPDEAPEGE